MTYSKYEWSAFTEADLLAGGCNGYDFGCGDSFVMPSCGTVTMSTYDDDCSLNGDNSWWYGNDVSEDRWGQDAYLNGHRIGGKLFAESYHVLCGSDGKTYYLVEIKVECHDSAGAGNGYFSFYGAVPPAGVTLTVTQTCNVSGSWLTYDKLSATCPAPQPGTICGRLTFDANNDDTEANGSGGWDAGFAGKTVQLIDAHGNVVATTTTDHYGSYSFSVEPGQYAVKFPQLSGYSFADKNVGNDNDDSDANANGVTDLITVTSGGTVNNVDASLQKANAAPTFTNVPVNGSYCIDENTTVVADLNATDADCDTLTYSIAGGEDAGKFKIDAHTGVLSFISAPDYENPTDVGGDNIYKVIVQVSDGKGGVTAQALTICVDDVAEGATCTVIEAEDMHLCGYTVKCASSASGNEYVALTDYNGYMQTVFNGSAGEYDLTVRHYDQSGSGYIKVYVNGQLVDTINLNADNNQWNETVINDLDLQKGDVIKLVTYGTGCEYALVDNIKLCPSAPSTGNLEGRVFVDANKDGIDNNEPGVAGVTVTLLDASGNVVGTATTAADGSYSFTDIPEGNYTVVFPTVVDGRVLTNANVGTDDTIDSDANPATGATGTVAVVAGQTTSDVDAGVKDPGTAAINGRIFVDANKNNIDDGEPGVPGVTVKLLDASGNVVATTTTGANGSYSFTGLDGGSYKVEFPTSVNGLVLVDSNVGTDDTIDSDANPTTGRTGTISLAIGQVSNDNDAGVADPGTASLGDRVWIDANGNGLQDGNETGLGGVTVTLFSVTGAVLATTTTAPDGSYLFQNLDAGTYRVGFGEPNGYNFTTANAGNDSLDSDANQVTGLTGPITLAVGEQNLTVDAGVVSENVAPVAVNDDGGKTCADTAKIVDVLANDSDADGDMLTIISVDGQTIVEGQTITASDGVAITLSGGQLVFNAAGTAYADAIVGTSNDATYTYTVSDGNGGTASATVDMTYCGVTNTLESIAASLPSSGTMFITLDTTGGEFYNLTINGTGDARLDGVTFDPAYCASAFLSIERNVDVPVTIYLADEASAPDSIVKPQNLDMVNWILNQDFGSMDNGDGTGTNYTEAEIQGAIWGLTDDFVFVNQNIPAFGTTANAQEIYQMALANGEGFVAGEGDIIGLILDPADSAAPESEQPFIIGVAWDDLALDCLC